MSFLGECAGGTRPSLKYFDLDVKKHQSAARAADGGRLASKSGTYGTRCVNYTVKETIDCVNLHRCTDSRTLSMHVETFNRVQ